MFVVKYLSVLALVTTSVCANLEKMDIEKGKVDLTRLLYQITRIETSSQEHAGLIRQQQQTIDKLEDRAKLSENTAHEQAELIRLQQETIGKLEDMAKRFERMILKQEGLIQQQQNTIEELEERTKYLKNAAHEQADINMQQQQMIENLENKVDMFENSSHEQNDTVRKQQQALQELENKLKETSVKEGTTVDLKERRVRRQVTENVVAFSATLKAINVTHIGVHQNIVFPDVITNIGNGYNNHHGVFVAPVAGLYMFTTTILSARNSDFAAAIEINGSDILRMYEKGVDNLHGSATQNLIVQLRKGDDVAVQCITPDRTLWGDKYSSFSGVLLHEFDTVNPIIG